MTQGSQSARAEIIERLRADVDWLAMQGVRLSQFGPDSDSDNVRVYLEHYTQDAHQILVARYGHALVVDTQSRRWSSRGGHE